MGINRPLARAEKAHILRDAEVSLFLGDADMVAQVAGVRAVAIDEWSRMVAAMPARPVL